VEHSGDVDVLSETYTILSEEQSIGDGFNGKMKASLEPINQS